MTPADLLREVKLALHEGFPPDEDYPFELAEVELTVKAEAAKGVGAGVKLAIPLVDLGLAAEGRAGESTLQTLSFRFVPGREHPSAFRLEPDVRVHLVQALRAARGALEELAALEAEPPALTCLEGGLELEFVVSVEGKVVVLAGPSGRRAWS